MTDKYSSSTNLAGGDGSATLVVATRSDIGIPAVFGDFAALEAYTATTSGIADATRINVDAQELAREVFAVGQLNNVNQVISLNSAYIRLNNDWVSVATNLVGSPGTNGIDGTDGLQLEFNSRESLDQFFIQNTERLVNGLPVILHLGNNVVTDFVWNGPDSPVDYVAGDQRWRTAASRVSNNSLFVGSTRISNAVENLVVTTAEGLSFLAVGSQFDNTGSSRAVVYKLSPETTLTVNTVSDQTLSDPFSVNYTTFGDNLTTDFDFIPGSAGNLRAQFFLGNDESGVQIFDETRVVSQAEVDASQFVSFGVGNPYLLDVGVNLFAKFSGIQMKGGVVTDPGSPFFGQVLIAFRSKVLPFARSEVFELSDFNGLAIVSELESLSGNDRLSYSAIKEVPALTKLRLGSFGTTATQSPLGAGDANKIKINFGAGGTIPSYLTLNSNGVVDFLVGGKQIMIESTVRVGRSGFPGEAILHGRAMYASDGIEANAVQVGSTFTIKVDDASTIWREEFHLEITPLLNAKLWFEFARDESGNDSGDIVTQQPTGTLSSGGWGNSNSAEISFYIIN